MKKLLRGILILLCLSLLLSSVYAVSGLPFTDVAESDWYFDSVEYCYSRGLMNGVSARSFAPDEGLSRAMFVTTLYRAAGSPSVSNYTPFTDVPTNLWYSLPVAWAYSQGIVNGTSATTFSPDVGLTRQQLVTLLYRYAKYCGMPTDAWVGLGGFVDASDIAPYAKDAFHWAYGANLIKGTDANHLSPNGACTRAQCATFLYRFLDTGVCYGSSVSRPSYNLGSCRSLVGTKPVLMFFIDDYESNWTEEEISNFWYNTVIPGLDYLEEQASYRSVYLDFSPGYYSTGATGISLKYNGIIDNDLMDGTYNSDLVDVAARCLGYTGQEQLYASMKEYYGSEDIVFLTLVDKPGRSYCINDVSDDGYTFIEHCVIYSSYGSNMSGTCPSTIAHEVLHLFGAEDYYDPYGIYPNRLNMAKEIYPNDIMLTVYYNIYDNSIGNFTAYTVGWSNIIPDECKNLGWWS